MFKLNIIAVFLSIVLFTACSKDDSKVALPNGSVSLQLSDSKDTVQMPLSILKDTTLVLDLKAGLSDAASSDGHWVTFAVDSTKILDYRLKYGDAILLPASCYLFYKPTTRISAGTTVSETAQLNIGQMTKLTEYSTYVLPVVIKTVDGKEDVATNKVLYFVFKTGKPLVINKTGWTIEAFSSQNAAANAPTMLLDGNNTSTYWTTNIQQQMPQWVTINFNKDVTFTALTYYLPPLLKYPTLGGYSTSIQIETSVNGTTWVNKGVFANNIVNNQQTIDLGVTTARYLRFTSLASVKYSSRYEAIFIAGISLVP